MECKCTTVAHSILGDGCDECQPQNAIADLKEQVTELEAENKRLREGLDRIIDVTRGFAIQGEDIVESELDYIEKIAKQLLNNEGV